MFYYMMRLYVSFIMGGEDRKKPLRQGVVHVEQ
jgi:hypothetical protein